MLTTTTTVLFILMSGCQDLVIFSSLTARWQLQSLPSAALISSGTAGEKPIAFT